jgi:hypothetical protein
MILSTRKPSAALVDVIWAVADRQGEPRRPDFRQIGAESEQTIAFAAAQRSRPPGFAMQ